MQRKINHFKVCNSVALSTFTCRAAIAFLTLKENLTPFKQ